MVTRIIAMGILIAIITALTVFLKPQKVTAEGDLPAHFSMGIKVLVFLVFLSMLAFSVLVILFHDALQVSHILFCSAITISFLLMFLTITFKKVVLEEDEIVCYTIFKGQTKYKVSEIEKIEEIQQAFSTNPNYYIIFGRFKTIAINSFMDGGPALISELKKEMS